MRLHHLEPPHASGLEAPPLPAERLEEASALPDDQLAVVPTCSLQNRRRAVESVDHRLRADHVLAGVQCGHDLPRMHGIRRVDAHDVDCRIGQHRGEVGGVVEVGKIAPRRLDECLIKVAAHDRAHVPRPQ
jgi:hypothetical protein